MRCNYCGNAYLTDEPTCEGCGSPKTARGDAAHQFFASLGKAVVARGDDDPINLLLKLRGGENAPAKDPTQLWVERAAKIALCILALNFLPLMAILPIVIMFYMWSMLIYMPYQALKRIFTWIAGSDART